MRTLFAQLTQNNEGLPAYSLIQEVHYYADNRGDSDMDIALYRKRYIRACVTNTTGELVVLLRPLRRSLVVREVPFQNVEGDLLSFHKEAILDFINAVGDNNPIHQEPPYVVPGLLIVETLWKQYGAKANKRGLSVVFHSATIAEDQIQLVYNTWNQSLQAYGGGALLFTAQFQ